MENTLKNDCYWNEERTVWTQPPVPIKIGDLVDIEVANLTVLGRYIGNGKGAAIIFNPTERIIKGFVTGRGIDKNPKLPTDQELLNLLQD